MSAMRDRLEAAEKVLCDAIELGEFCPSCGNGWDELHDGDCNFPAWEALAKAAS